MLIVAVRIQASPTFFCASAVAVLAGLLSFDILHPESGVEAVQATLERNQTRIVSRARVAGFLAERARPSDAVAAEDIGVVGYFLPNPMLDLFGLNDEHATHGQRRVQFVESLMARNPAYLVLASRSGSEFVPSFPMAASLRACPALPGATPASRSSDLPPRPITTGSSRATTGGMRVR